MDLHALTLLVEILDAGNLSEAARRLKMSRANVSYHLSAFERAVGLQLVRRTTRRIEPTEIGLQLYEHGRKIRNELEAARESVATLGQSLQGRVRLSVPSGYGQMVMSPWLIDFKRAYPGIVLDVAFENRVVDLLRDEVDIAVRVMSDPPDHLVARDMGMSGQWLLAVSYSGFFLNLFNLIPLSPLDGGRITAVLSPKLWLLGVPVLVGLFLMKPNPMLFIIAIMAAPQVMKAWHFRADDPEHASYYQTSAETKLTYGTAYVGLIIFLAMMVHDVHEMLGAGM